MRKADKAQIAAVLMTVGLLCCVVPALAQQQKPNILFILADNTGYGDLGVYGGGELRGAPYPKVFNIESDPREEHSIGAQYEWVIGPTLKVAEEYKASLAKHPNPPASNITRF